MYNLYKYIDFISHHFISHHLKEHIFTDEGINFQYLNMTN